MGVVPGDRMVGEPAQDGVVVVVVVPPDRAPGAVPARVLSAVVVRGEGPRELERPHPLVTCRDPGEHRARQGLLAVHGVARGGDRQRPGGGHAERVHGLADHVLAQHLGDACQPVPAAREGGASRALEVQVAAVRELAHQQSPPVAEPRRVATELVPGVGLRSRGRTLGHMVADQQTHPLVASEVFRIEAQLGRERLVEEQQLRDRGLGGLPGHHQLGELGGVAGAEARRGGLRGAHAPTIRISPPADT